MVAEPAPEGIGQKLLGHGADECFGSGQKRLA